MCESASAWVCVCMSVFECVSMCECLCACLVRKALESVSGWLQCTRLAGSGWAGAEAVTFVLRFHLNLGALVN